jgi:TonB-dependent receptor
MTPKHSPGQSFRRWVRFVLLGVMSALSVHAAAEPKRTYNLPADDAVAAFRRFSDFSGREILFAAEVARGVRTNPVQGEFTALEALKVMLSGTRLQAGQDEKTGALAVKRLSDPNGVRAAQTETSDRPQREATNEPTSARGAIRGVVTDASTRTPLAGASITLPGTSLSAVTDSQGEYFLANVPVGTVELLAAYVGQPEKRVRVDVASGLTAQGDFALGNETIQLGAYVVQGTRDGQARALSQQKNATNLLTVVSSDAVGQFPDAYVGDALRRLVGVNVEEDQGEATGVTIRGIEPDYNNITINGIEVASAGTPGGGTSNLAGRPVGLDIFSVDLIDSIEVAKTTTPDMDGAGLGGAVNVKTKTAFSRGAREFIGSGEYTYADLGDGREGYRASLSYSDIFGAQRNFGALFAITHEDRDRRVERVIPQQYNAAGIIQRARANGYNQTLVRTSYMANLDYKLTPATTFSLKSSYANYDDKSDYDRAQIHADQRRYQNEFVRDHRKKTLYTFDFSGETRFGNNELRFGGVYSYSDEDKPENQKHIFRTANNAIDIVFNQSDPVKPYPVLGSFSAGNGVPTTTAEKALFTLDEAKFRGNYQEETRWTWFADFKRDLSILPFPARLKAGVKYSMAEKSDNAWSYVFGAGAPVLNYNDFPVLPTTRIQDNWNVFVLDKSRMLELFNGSSRNTTFRYRPEGSVSDSIVEDFKAREDLYAGYVSGVVDIRKLRLEGGVRFERLDGAYVNYGYDEAAYATIPANAPVGAAIDITSDPVAAYPNVIKAAPGKGSFSNFLPSLHARYQASRDLIVRSSLSTNVGRPKFTDVAGLASFRAGTSDDGSSFRLTTGNPDLKASTSLSGDLTFSYFGFRPLGILEVGAFFKNIDDRVFKEVTLRNATTDDVARYGTAANRLAVGDTIQVVSRGNADTTKVQGVEFDWRMELGFLPKPLDGLGIGTNYTYADSEEKIPFIQTLPRNHPTQPARAGQTVSFPKQPRHSGNVYVSFNRWGFDARFAGNYIGRNLRSWNDATSANDEYNRSRWRYDALVSYRLGRRWSFNASVVNLTDEPLVTYVGQPHLVRNSEFLGRTGRIAIRYVFR